MSRIRCDTYLALIFVFAITWDRVFADTCSCSPIRCGEGETTCNLKEGNSCFRFLIQVDGQKNPYSSPVRGCHDTPMESNVSKRLAITNVQNGLIFVAIFQCGSDGCNHNYEGGFWTSIGVDNNCNLPPVEKLEVKWNENGTVINNVSLWCPKCDLDAIKLPGNESLCHWINKQLNVTVKVAQPVKPERLNKIMLYVSIGVVAGSFVLGGAFGFFEYLKARKVQKSAPRVTKKKEPDSRKSTGSLSSGGFSVRKEPSSSKDKEKMPMTSAQGQSAVGASVKGSGLSVNMKTAKPVSGKDKPK